MPFETLNLDITPRIVMVNRTVLLLLIALFIANSAHLYGQSLTVRRLNSELDQPVFATHAPGSPNRIYIVEKKGAIRTLNRNTGVLNAVDFMDVPNVAFAGSEQGLLGLAFHPNFETNGYFYVFFTNSENASRLVRFTATNFNRGNASTAFPILEIEQPQPGHNGGWIGFGSDGYLYVSTGDGGGSDDNDPGHTPGIGNAQDTTDNLMGKILRIDINHDDFPGDSQRNYAIPANNPFVGTPNDDEIFAYGLRNPWRCSFDRASGDLYIADVGQDRREEVNVIPAGSTGGENLGWRLREGVIASPGNIGGPPPADAIDPIYDYEHGNGDFRGFSVTGGYVYRGPISELQGHYFFGDFVSSNFWSLKYDGSRSNSIQTAVISRILVQWDNIVSNNGGTVANYSSFAEDSSGQLYILDFIDGEIFRIEDVAMGQTPGTFGGNFTVSVTAGGDLRVSGETNTDQCIIVEATNDPGQYVFSSLQENGSSGTTFNGQPTLVVEGVSDDVRIDLRSGRKVVILSNGDAPEFIIPDDLRISATGSDSAIVILDSLNVGGRTDVTTRSGDDAILFMTVRFLND